MNQAIKVEVQILNAFVDNGQGGNPAGVVLHADELTNTQKLKVAAGVGLSETAFVSNSTIADYKLDFFTPNRQIAHCGHATIAAFSYLSQLGVLAKTNSSKETIDGRREILIQGDLAFMEQKAPTYSDVSTKQHLILQSLGLKKENLLPNAPISLVNTGNSFIIVPVANAEILKNIQPDFDLIEQVSEIYDLIGYYVFTTEVDDEERDASTRMFAPRYGILEEAGTGMAAGPLAAYFYDLLQIKKQRFLIQQGWFMRTPSPSLILVDLTFKDEKITKIMAGGKGKSIATMIIDI
ncbi:PhzF family phenazine biosynthesis protein [Haliscomenobacter hydrossis]|uniref:Phenazine biosynthesis protein PhzF family n=1 Tax=Haliscomenobacter hydrossis (strain ATCC 27775 / DSM 1100 / LMG 10767 / O) TaxID=760192 RepID=F4KVT3_HALH1|nr:PhzF family phenazine biosynthesis protein [Haliscomenobacter hydrossis]AEE53508.1 phenazine biosynthesis protein PhzF family [Haliscomenobacter hydrossis DSM 1100]